MSFLFCKTIVLCFLYTYEAMELDFFTQGSLSGLLKKYPSVFLGWGTCRAPALSEEGV